MYKWPLNIDNFSQEDKENISRFILNSKKWTQDNQVKIFEQKFAEYIGTKYAVFVCNGSAANTIIAHCIKDLYSEPSKNIVVLPSTTWQTSCSPWIREGFQPVFIDISLKNFSIHQELLEDYISKNYHSIACVFPTSLIGYSPNMDFFTYLQNTYNIKIMFDNCENTLGSFNNKNISSYFTSTTSTYFGHQIQSVEGGFIFTNDDIEYEYMLMLRNHGLTRSLKSYNLDYQHYQNNQVDNLFDFYCLGSNYRNTDINAFIGQLDFKKTILNIDNKYIICIINT
jgi:CDP-6-deoxy-D-xylo-4-hexulose-3-dehydrase